MFRHAKIIQIMINIKLVSPSKLFSYFSQPARHDGAYCIFPRSASCCNEVFLFQIISTTRVIFINFCRFLCSELEQLYSLSRIFYSLTANLNFVISFEIFWLCDILWGSKNLNLCTQFMLSRSKNFISIKMQWVAVKCIWNGVRIEGSDIDQR